MPHHFERFRPRDVRRRDGPSRREVLEGALAAAGLMLASCRTRPSSGASVPRVVVVGAGLAGLACAHELRQHGADVVVLEARPRVGGRVHSLDDLLDGASVEAGGEFVGANHPCWQGYARSFGLALDPVTGEDEDVESPLVLMNERVTGRDAETFWREVDEMQGALTKLAREVDGDAPWNHAFASALDMRHMSGWCDEQQVSRRAQHGFRVLLAADAGVPTKRQSLLATLAMIAGGGHEAFWTSSESYRCSGGNARLARALASSVGAERVVTGSPVTKIRWKEGGPVEVTSARSTVTADRVVLAVPPTTWPRIAFDPPLPVGIAPQLGMTVKYVASTSRRAWRDTHQSAEAITDGPISLTWEPARGTAADRAALSCFSSGEAAEFLRSKKGAQLKEVVLGELEGLYPGFAEAFVAGRFLDWPSEEWTRAGYSFPAPGETTTRVKRLREPFGPLVVAGEHASSRFPGYMEGALESGVRAAALVMRSG